MTTGMERRFELDGPLHLGWTLQLSAMWGTATWLKVDEDGAWYARRTPDGPGTVHIRHLGDHLVARAYGDGGAVVLDEVPAIVGLGAPGVHDVEPQHAFVAEAIKKLWGYRQGRTGQVYPTMVSAGLGQKVTGKNSKAVLRRLAWRWGEPAPGPREDLRLLPDPRQLARIPYYRLHPIGIEKHRADLVRRVADRARAMQRAADMPPREGREHLEKLRGIGPWTSGVIMGGPLGDPDAVPIGDFHLPNWVAWNLAGEPRADDDRMMELLEPYAPYRGLVARMVKGAGRSAPKFGPRHAILDIRDL